MKHVLYASIVEKEHTDIGLPDNMNFARISGQVVTSISC